MRWILKEGPPKSFLEKFPEYPKLALILLWNRNIKTQEEIDNFFNPDYHNDLHDPFLMKGMAKVVDRIIQAIEKKEKIVIYGDYDADGICSSVILSSLFKEMNLKKADDYDVYIPDRFKEGYGLNFKNLEQIIKGGAKLIITVDCGITDFDEVKFAKEKGVDVIIVDHHLTLEKLPDAYCIIDPKQAGDDYPFKFLSAAGVVFKLVQALLLQDFFKSKIKEGFEKWLLDLVAISTVADMMPLVDENRIFVKYGLVVLAQTQRKGLIELMKVAGISPKLLDSKNLITNLDVDTLAFVLVPRINAASRMDHANTSFELLISDDDREVERLAKILDKHNKERQKLVDKITNDIKAKIIAEGKKETPLLIFEGSKDWPAGIVGIVSGKLTDEFYRPSFVYTILNEKESRGSCRSIPEINVVEAMKSCKDMLVDFGGHAAAGGYDLFNEHLENFKNCIRKYIEEELDKQNIKIDELVPKLFIDVEIMPQDVNFEIYDSIKKFKPAGQANPEPIFLMKNLKINQKRTVGNNGKHLTLYLESENFSVKGRSASAGHFRGISFNNGHFDKEIKIGDKIDIVFNILENEWQGERRLELKILDIKKLENNK